MAKTLSQDLRSRLIGAVEGGLSCRAAAARFAVGVTTAIRWVRVFRSMGVTAPKPKGGDLRSHRIEACRDVILGAIEAKVDITLVELAEWLRREHGVSFAPSTVWRFLDRHDITFKKKPRTPASKSGPMSPFGVRRGPMPSPGSTRNAWCSSMKPAPRPRWRACAAVPNAVGAAGRRCRMGIGRPPPSPAPCGLAASPHQWCWTGR